MESSHGTIGDSYMKRVLQYSYLRFIINRNN